MAPAAKPNSPMPMNRRAAMITQRSLPGSSEQVDGAEQTDPDDIDEVPVVAGHLDGVVVAGGELAEAGAQQHDEDEGGAASDVGAVKANEGEEGRPEDAAGQGHAFVDELAILVGLAGEKAEAEHQSDYQPQHQAT